MTTKSKPQSNTNQTNSHILLCELVFVGHCTVLTIKVQASPRTQGSPELLDLWKASHAQGTVLDNGTMMMNKTL